MKKKKAKAACHFLSSYMVAHFCYCFCYSTIRISFIVTYKSLKDAVPEHPILGSYGLCSIQDSHSSLYSIAELKKCPSHTQSLKTEILALELKQIKIVIEVMRKNCKQITAYL